jgi:hypothetical protein
MISRIRRIHRGLVVQVDRSLDATENLVLVNLLSGWDRPFIVNLAYILIIDSSLVVDHLSQAAKVLDRACVIRMYCDYRDESQQTTVNLIGALLNQILLENPIPFTDIITDLHEAKKRPWPTARFGFSEFIRSSSILSPVIHMHRRAG